MDFGKLLDISSVDFSLPPNALGTETLLQKLPPRLGKPKVYVGATGWAMPQWVGKTYPKNAKPKDFLKHYAKQFNTIELNTTHYRIPDIATIEKWRAEVPVDFKFCPKIPQTISHARDLGLTNRDLPLFLENIAHLENNLGCCFMQLPPHFGSQSLKLLERFLETWGKIVPLAIEVRHEEFFADEQHFNALFNTLEYMGISSVITDVSGRRDVLHQKLTSGTAMIRFIGNDLHLTDYQRIDDWVLRLKQWFELGLHEVFFFTHEPDNLLAPEIAVYLTQEIEKAFEAVCRSLVFFEENEPQQMSLF
jgi:uncharacterized protein YecE (DUF72 family)